MAAGALAGLIAGPFGIVGNLMVGAGVGYLSKSEKFGEFLFGDGENDIKAGKAAGCKTVLIGEGEYGQDICVGSLKDFVDQYLR